MALARGRATHGRSSVNDGAHDSHDEARVEDLFHRALELEPRERAAFLEREAGGEPQLVREVGELLAALGEAPSCMDRPLWGLGEQLEHDAREAEVVGQRVGPYVIKRLLGEGGMGEVYLAEQTEPLRREVALKRIKLGMDTHEVVRRFESERLALARLNHPNIAAVHDAGVTPAGRPYFVMEYVPGERITEYCDRRRLGVADRLAIFVQVCEAVQHAHQKGIIHRDLKPGNVLVKVEDGRPMPKIIDFGVAKATAVGDLERTAFTRNGQLLGTPGYMSPEQAVAGHDVDTRTDVYSLGVMLYELLTGVLPFDVESWRTLGADEIRRVLASEEAPRPSARVASLGMRARVLAARRLCDPRELGKRLRGELDWVVLRALERDPARRYGSASELALDLLRHLEGESVSAGPPSLLRRATRFATLHRREALAGAAVVVLATAGAFVFALYVTVRNEDLGRQLAASRDARAPRGERGDVEPLVPPGLHTPVDAQRPYASVRVRNGGAAALQPGDLVSYAGRADDERFGDVPLVLLAERDAGAVFLGVVTGALDGGGDGVSVLAAEVPPGGLASVAVQGTLVPVKIEGTVHARDALGLSEQPGLATRHDGDGPVVGVAMEAWRGDGEPMVLAVVAPTWSSAVSSAARASWTLGGALDDPGATRPTRGESGPVTLLLGASGDDGPAHVAGYAPAPDAPGSVASASGGGSDPPDETLGTTSDDPGPGHAGGGGGGGNSYGIDNTGALTFSGLLSRSGTPQPLEAPASTEPLELGTLPDGTLADGTLGDKHQTPGIDGTGTGTNAGGGKGSDGGDTLPDGSEGSDAGTSHKSQHEKSGLLLDDSTEAPFGLHEHWGDYDGDSLVDLLLDVEGEAPRLFHNQGQGTFVDVTGWLRLDVPDALGSAQWIDHDHDGRLDLIGLVPADGRLVLQRGDGHGGFVDETLAAGLGRLPAGALLQVLDVDGDQRVDLRLLTRAGGLLLLLDDGASGFRVVVLRDEPVPRPPVDDDASDGGSTTSTGDPGAQTGGVGGVSEPGKAP
ncbi:MAG: protein kinase [Planctomycetes bacterium]|nr:protein kinase [Planctomycetota bacterium]